MRNFHFLKQHIIFYYPNKIKIYRNVIGFIIKIKKTMYITQIKDFFKLINIKNSYEKLILDYNVKKFNLLIKADLNMFFLTKILIQTNQNTKL